MTDGEAACFLSVCAVLIDLRVIQFQEVKKYILEIKEFVDHDSCSD